MNRQLLINAYATMFKLGCQISMSHDTPGVIYDAAEHSYVVRIPGQCNLLETVLIGAEDCTGDWLSDAAVRLESTRSFLEGFISGLGFKFRPDDKPT